MSTIFNGLCSWGTLQMSTIFNGLLLRNITDVYHFNGLCSWGTLQMSTIFNQTLLAYSPTSFSLNLHFMVLAFMHLYSIFNLWSFLSILFYIYFLIWYWNTKPKRSMVPTLFAFFFLMRAIPKGPTFGLRLYVLRLQNVHVLYYIQLL